MLLKIKPGYGYWETTRHPIGGEFHRAGDHGLIITDIIRDNLNGYKGCTHKARVQACNRTIAFNIKNTIEL